MRRARITLAGLGVVLALCSCAATGYQPVQPTMPAAKAGLLPEYRIFYDALEEYGDWILIEPYGYLFRPRVNFVAWQPYQDGFWVPSDVWGWVWISAEPFGWATYHYGSWMNDRFQGWVWIPGLDWGPAWVSWQLADAYVGWAPLGPRGLGLGGPYTYVPLGQLGATNLKAQIVPAESIAEQVAVAKAIHNNVERGGVTINRGPKFEVVERAAGPLARVRISSAATAAGSKSGTGAGGSTPTIEEEIEATRRAAEEATRQARNAAQGGGSPPPRLSVVRPVLVPPPAAKPAPPGGRAQAKGKAAPPDTTR